MEDSREEYTQEELRKRWKPLDSAAVQISEEDRKKQLVPGIDRFGREVWLPRERHMAKIPASLKEVIGDNLDTELKEMKSTEPQELEKSYKILTERLQAESYTDCMMKSSWMVTTASFVIGAYLTWRTKNMAIMVVGAPAGTAFDYLRALHKCHELHEQGSLLAKVRRQRTFANRQMTNLGGEGSSE